MKHPLNLTHSHTMFRIVGAMLMVFIVSACSSAPYRAAAFDPGTLSGKQTQSSAVISVTAAVPGQEHAEEIFGIPVYKRGIQPVWLSITNQSAAPVRYAPAGTDPEYFAPLEVAYMHRKMFSKEGHAAMERRFYDLAMPRSIAAGETASGFVFTHASPGTKSIYVDVFGLEENSASFAFFLDVPGFTPDHSTISFTELYSPEQRLDLTPKEFRDLARELDCCTRNRDGDPVGLPVSVAAVGKGTDILRALLRAGWYETPARHRESLDPEQAHYLFERLPDAVFRTSRGGEDERNELHVWMAPWRVDGENVWIMLTTHFIGQRTPLRQVLFGAAFDPDLAESRNYLLQNMWYSQSLAKLGWLRYDDPVTIDQQRTDHLGNGYFSDGFRVVMWLSGKPVSMTDTRGLGWDTAPTGVQP